MPRAGLRDRTRRSPRIDSFRSPAVSSTLCLRSSVPRPAVLRPESFRGGCPFGARDGSLPPASSAGSMVVPQPSSLCCGRTIATGRALPPEAVPALWAISPESRMKRCIRTPRGRMVPPCRSVPSHRQTTPRGVGACQGPRPPSVRPATKRLFPREEQTGLRSTPLPEPRSFWIIGCRMLAETTRRRPECRKVCDVTSATPSEHQPTSTSDLAA